MNLSSLSTVSPSNGRFLIRKWLSRERARLAVLACNFGDSILNSRHKSLCTVSELCVVSELISES